MQTTFRGIFLTSGHPAATADFYRRVAGLAHERAGEEGGYAYWRLDRGGVQLAIHEAGAFADHAYPPLAGST